ncbi:hypothetical protein TWF506_004767 [Arthrobotrys conoides]|uniref:J domain-containing protein n=1 Tax=Arthrobotrys conoides TaxID=74498 RepID=A0AAN8N071_9PEZI
MQTYYEILGVPVTASSDEIRTAWKRRALEVHPDKNVGASGATGAFQKLQEAYECFIDSVKRGEYDRAKGLRPRWVPSPPTTPKRPAYAPAAKEPPPEEVFRQRWAQHESMRPMIPVERVEIRYYTRELEGLRRRLARYEERIGRWDEERKAKRWALCLRRERRGRRMFPAKAEDHTKEEMDAHFLKDMKDLMSEIEKAEKGRDRSREVISNWEKEEVEMLKQKEELEEKIRRGHAAKEKAKKEEEERKAARAEAWRRARREEEVRKMRQKEEEERKRRQKEEEERKKMEVEKRERRRRHVEAAERRQREAEEKKKEKEEEKEERRRRRRKRRRRREGGNMRKRRRGGEGRRKRRRGG